MGSRTISVCDLGDAVCDYDPDAEDEMNPAAVAVHTSYARSATDSWTLPLYQIVEATPESVVPFVPPAGQIVASAGS